ncbi:LysR family transcriptional regulator [Herbiconiux moechotypicola]|uniref:LysR family transcriptional regulator n=1 Tax=Herbiconiux moechotypicola TaxID=637393 RepID=A0ABN3E3B3_9MICO|nr:LysR family transcriptional regulator [Herbiconiux moechotypicola]MCS5731354.1 LysR family transcriptional regulator [Herbiconiux moechotypicola]
MQLGWIRSFVAVVEHGGFVRAGLHLRRAQSRVSADVGSLERELGSVLVERSRRPVTLTASGEAFLGHARDILSSFDKARVEVAALGGEAYGAVRLGSISSVASLVLPDVLERFSRLHRAVSVDVIEMPTASLAELLFTGTADLALIPRAHVESFPELSWTELWTEPLLVLVHTGHDLAGEGSVGLSSLAGLDIITPGDGRSAGGISPEIGHLLSRAGVVPASSRLVASPSTLASMVRAGLGVGVMSALGVSLVGESGLATLAIEDDHAVRRVVIAHVAGKKLSPATLEMERFIRDYTGFRGDLPITLQRSE